MIWTYLELFFKQKYASTIFTIYSRTINVIWLLRYLDFKKRFSFFWEQIECRLVNCNSKLIHLLLSTIQATLFKVIEFGMKKHADSANTILDFVSLFVANLLAGIGQCQSHLSCLEKSQRFRGFQVFPCRSIRSSWRENQWKRSIKL